MEHETQLLDQPHCGPAGVAPWWPPLEPQDSPVIIRAARTLHLMEAMGMETDPEGFVARIEAAAEATTGFPREDIAAEAEFIVLTDEWDTCDMEATPADPREDLLAVPIDPARVLAGLTLLSGQTHPPQVLSGCQAHPTSVIAELRMQDYAELLAGVQHLRNALWTD
ncbi:hypothetical protein [Nocardiopsis sp. NRRL B-16309]|uniref:hypothetical protein n=1 Tax=Nocardiopsis sp. NRRL B-16309 TaxID=1519494 RepID=UPI0006ADCF30|nr:hypothetical protein [Nocardiopsis sp. NRRL B-16309]KOX13696.1 hypothetical protein ADL05_18630 [Nocardiopsis sp. NRRL B-16309]